MGIAQFNDTAYIYTFGGIQNESCNQAVPTWDGGYIFIGTSNSFGPGLNNIYAIKTDSLCNYKWSHAYGGNQVQNGFSVTPTLDKGYAMLGFTNSFGNGGYDVYLIKTDSTGKTLWEKTYGGTDWDFGYSISQTKDSGFVICGQTYSYGAGNGDVYVIKTDKNGDTVWTKAIGGTGYDEGNCVYVKQDSLYYIAGITTSFGIGDTNMYFIEINNQGKVEWDTTCGSTHHTLASSIHGTTSSGFIVYGSADSIPDSAYARNYGETIMWLHNTRTIRWWDIFKPIVHGESIGKDAVQTQKGHFLTIGTTSNCGFGGLAMSIQMVDSNSYWQSAYCAGGTSDEYGNSIAYRNKNNVVFAGASNSSGYSEGGFDFFIIRFTYDSIAPNYIIKTKNVKDTLSPASVNSLLILNSCVKLFPNPVSFQSTLLVQGNAGDHYYIRIYNDMGQCLANQTPLQPYTHGQFITQINKADYTAGIYLYKIFDRNNNVTATGKFVIE